MPWCTDIFWTKFLRRNNNVGDIDPVAFGMEGEHDRSDRSDMGHARTMGCSDKI